MSCENVQERISLLLDRRVPAGEQEDVLAHLGSCRQCQTRFESLQKVRAALRGIKDPSVPASLVADLRVMASHERARQLARVSVSSRLSNWAAYARLWFDNLMRPMALPFGGGVLSALVIFSILVPSLTARYEDTGDEFVTDPYGQVVVLSSTGAFTPESTAGLPQIEPTYAQYPEDANVVWLMIGENGKVQDYSVTKGRLTPDMISIISISKFMPATFMGVPTPGLVKMVQRPVRRSLRS